MNNRNLNDLGGGTAGDLAPTTSAEDGMEPSPAALEPTVEEYRQRRADCQERLANGDLTVEQRILAEEEIAFIDDQLDRMYETDPIPGQQDLGL